MGRLGLTDATRKANERTRRRERGEVLVQVWLEPHIIAMLDRLAKPSNYTRAEAIQCAIWNVDAMSRIELVAGVKE